MGILLENLKEETLKEKIGTKFRRMMGARPLKDYTEVRKRVLSMIDNCKTKEEIDYLIQDFRSANIIMGQMIKDFPESKAILEDQLHWINTVAMSAANKKANEIKKNN